MAVVHLETLQNPTASITRRTILARGAKLAYAAPVVAATMQISAAGVDAVASIACAVGCTRDSQCPGFSGGNTGCVTILQFVRGGVPTTGICRTSESATNCFSSTDCQGGQACVDRVNFDDGIGVCATSFGACTKDSDCGSGRFCAALQPANHDDNPPVSPPGVCINGCNP